MCRESSLSPVGGIWRFRQDDLPSPDSSDDCVYVPPVIPPSSLGTVHNTPDATSSTSPVCLEDVGSLPVNDEEDAGEMSPKRNAVVLSADHTRILELAEDGSQARKLETGRSDGLEEDYLFIAGHHLARATDKELAGDFEVSFGLYKLGIDILLNGVQSKSIRTFGKLYSTSE